MGVLDVVWGIPLKGEAVLLSSLSQKLAYLSVHWPQVLSSLFCPQAPVGQMLDPFQLAEGHFGSLGV